MARDLTDVIVGFGRAARAAGIDASPDRVQSMTVALSHLDVLSGPDAYWAGRLTLCGSPDDVARYDRVFAAYFSGTEHQPPRRTQLVPASRAVAMPVAAPGDDEMSGERDVKLASASDTELLRSRDFAQLNASERDAVRRLISLLSASPPLRRSRRFRPRSRGRLDVERTVRAMVRRGGEPVRVRRRVHRTKPRRVVLIVDISGSMAPYADAMLRFAHAAARRRVGRPDAVEVFTLGTRLTRVSKQIRQREADRALSAVAAEVPDWSGGTQLGLQLRQFLDRWGGRGMARGAVVVIASDGWERGDARLLGEQMARLHRLAHQVVWVNPHRARPGFEPLTAGMVAALPNVDAFVSGHSLNALEELTGVIGSA